MIILGSAFLHINMQKLIRETVPSLDLCSQAFLPRKRSDTPLPSALESTLRSSVPVSTSQCPNQRLPQSALTLKSPMVKLATSFGLPLCAVRAVRSLVVTILTMARRKFVLQTSTIAAPFVVAGHSSRDFRTLNTCPSARSVDTPYV
jgi:hypothetical protein